MKKLITTMMALLIGLMPLQAAASKSIRYNEKEPQVSVPVQAVKSQKSAIYQNSFEDYADFAISFAPWIMIDGDGGIAYHIEGTEYPNMSYVGSFIIFNPSATTPAVIAPEWAPHSGNKFAACFASHTAPNNDWLITPQVQLTANNVLKFWAKSVTPAYGLEKFKVGISTTGTAAADFTIISGATTVDAPTTWTEFSYDLAAYAGQNVYVSIQCVSDNAFAFMLDDFSIIDTNAPDDVTPPAISTLTGLTNGVGLPLNITATVTDEIGIASVVGHYQIAGATSWTDFPMTATKLSKTYSGTIPAQANVTIGKVKFTTTDTVTPLANTGDSPESFIYWKTPDVFLNGENFDAVTVPALPFGWTTEDNLGDGRMWETTGGYAQSEPNALNVPYNSTAAVDEWIYSPAFIPVANTAYEVKFSYRAHSAVYPERFEVKYGTAATAASMTNVITAPINVVSTDYITDSFIFTPTTAAPIHIGFHGISDFDMYRLYLDDIKISLAPTDVTPPVAATPSGTVANSGSAMTIQTVVTDQTGIASVVGKYQLTGQTTWTEFAMTAAKAIGTYTGTIPAQAAVVTGKVKFTTTDTVAPTANSGDSPEYDIAWQSAPPEPTAWLEWGSGYYAINNGIGMASDPWWAAIDYDLGANTVKLVRVETSVSSSSSPLAIPFKAVRVSQTVPGTLVLAEDLNVSGVINANAATQAVATVSFDSQVNISGYFAVALAMPKGFINRDETVTTAHTWLASDAAQPASMVLLSTIGDGEYTGAWWIRLGVIPGNGINDEIEMLPGKSELSQNYPNPFNPTTSINFYNNMTGIVKLTVLNAKGQTVATLINNNIVAGNHSVNFDGARFNSGVYFYKLETPTATITKKMLLVK